MMEWKSDIFHRFNEWLDLMIFIKYFKNCNFIGYSPLCVEFSWLIDSLVRVGAEEVTESLDQVRREDFARVRVEVEECWWEKWDWESLERADGDDLAPRLDSRVHRVLEEVDHEEILCVVRVIGRNVVQEVSSDDAAASPHLRACTDIDSIVELWRRFLDEGESLGVADDLRCLKCILEIIDHQVEWRLCIACFLIDFDASIL